MVDVTDDDGFEAMYAAHYDDLLRFALRRVTEPADAADVVADVWLVAWRRRADLPGVLEQRLWLFGVARRVLANHRRGELRRSRLADELRGALERIPRPTPASDGPVADALAALAPADRDLVSLVAWEGLTPREVAVVLGCTPAAARVRLHRARKRLRGHLTRSPARGSRRAPTTNTAEEV